MGSYTQTIDWESVYNILLPRVYNFFRYRVGDDAVAEDLTSKTFEKAWRHHQKYRHDLGAFSTWLFTIARNTATDYFRKHRVNLSLEEISELIDNNSPEDIIENQNELRYLSLLLADLPNREQELIALKYGSGLTNREIAQITELSESNVGTILNRVVKKLRSKWEHNYE